MTREQLEKMLANASESVRRLNVKLARVCPIMNDPKSSETLKLSEISKPKKRIRQSSKPLLNDLESEWFDQLKFKHFSHVPLIRPQSLRFKLANGLWYKPDFTAMLTSGNFAWEVKGPYAHRGGFENLKMAATLYQEWNWVLVWKDENRWFEQRVLS